MVQINITDSELFTEIKVAGEIDASSSIELDNALNQSLTSEKNILIDLSQLSYISSAGLGALISRLDELNERKISMVLFGLNEQVREVFTIIGLDALFLLKDTRSEALNALNEA